MPGWNFTAESNRALKFDKDTAREVEFGWRTRDLAAKKLQSKQ